MAAMKEMKEMMAAMEARINTLEGEASASKVERAALKAEVAALKKAAKAAAKESKEEPAKKTKASKAAAKSDEESETEEKKEKPKREIKPSAKSDAWRALCDAVRAVHKKDAMKIAKILKDGGNMEPTKEDIEAAAAELPQKETTPTQSETEKPAKSGSESDGSEGAAKKRGRPKKAASE